ncbi:hypothetical protein JST97_08990 [bacterium]|nr:hypothetical protein [bacterium]
MRALLLSLLLTASVWADPPDFIPSYSFQSPHPPLHQRSQTHHTYRPSVSSRDPGTIAPTYYPQTPAQAQAPVPAHLSNWGGTVVQTEQPGLISITSNGVIPAGSVVGIGRGDHFLGQARVTSSSSNSAQLSTNSDLALSPGDWVSVISVPAPKPVQTFAGYSTGRYQAYHPSSSNADPTYQRWLHQGFTLGGVHRGRIYSSGGFSRGYYR